MSNDESHYHSDPLITKILFSLRIFKNGRSIPYTTRAERLRGALSCSPNIYRKKFFIYASGVTTNIAVWLLMIGLFWAYSEMIFGSPGGTGSQQAWHPTLDILASGAVPFMSAGTAVIGVSMKFDTLMKESDKDPYSKTLSFTRQDLIRPLVVGFLIGLSIIVGVLGILLYASFNNAVLHS